MTSGLPFGFKSRAVWLPNAQSTAVEPLDAELRAGEFLSGSSGLQLGVVSSTPLSSSVFKQRGLGLEMLEPHHPSRTPPTPGANVAPSGGGGSSSSTGYFAAVLEGLHGPLIVCLSFRPSEHVMSPLARVCFFFLSAFLAAGGSHTSHLAVDCCLVPGRLSCTRACVHKPAQQISCFQPTHFLKVNVNANRVSRVLIPVRALVKTKSLLKTIVSCLSRLTAAVGGLLIIGLYSICFSLTLYSPCAIVRSN